MTGARRVVTVMVAALLGALLVLLVDRAGAPATSEGIPRATDPERVFASESPRSGATATGPTQAGPAEAGPVGPARARSTLPTLRARSADLRSPRATAPPTLLRIPSLGVDMAVVAAGVDEAGAMALPETPFDASWYRYGAGPLDRSGATVLAGHVDSRVYGVGPLARLDRLDAGDRIEVTAGRRTITYRVRSVQRVEKSVLDLPAVFSRTGSPRLHLITCGGEFDPVRRSYEDNVVVVAHPLEGTG